MKSNLFSILKIPELPTNRNYWIVRSNGGIFYDDFVMHNYIAISWDYVTTNIMCNESEATIRAIIESQEKVNPTYDEEDDTLDTEERGIKSKITTIFNKLQRFINEFSVNDIVLVPSKDSDRISIGIITSTVYEDSQYVQNYLSEDPNTELTLCPYFKRRKVRWLKHLTKQTADIYLMKAFNSQHALSKMNDYAPYIDRAIYPIYKKNDEVHSTFHAGHPNGMSLKELSDLAFNLNNAISDISEQCELPISEKDVQVKLNIHSPGLIELIGYGAAAGTFVSILMFSINHLINGGSFNLSFKKDDKGNLDFSINAETKGLKEHDQAQKKLELKEQAQMAELIKELDVKNPDLISEVIFHYNKQSNQSSALENNEKKEE